MLLLHLIQLPRRHNQESESKVLLLQRLYIETLGRGQLKETCKIYESSLCVVVGCHYLQAVLRRYCLHIVERGFGNFPRLYQSFLSFNLKSRQFRLRTCALSHLCNRVLGDTEKSR